MRQQRSRLGYYQIPWFFLLAAIAASSACTGRASPTSNQNTGNQSAPQNSAPAKSNSNNSSTKSELPAKGNIEVGSSPPGARVLLVANDEGGAGEPQAKGITPTTITGLAPGKYTVDLEKPGYRFFQKEVNVRAGSTAKVAANLRKQ